MHRYKLLNDIHTCWNRTSSALAMIENQTEASLSRVRSLSEIDIDRIIEMAWEDRTTFDAIFYQFGLKEAEVRALMKSQLKFGSYKAWRKRVEACKTKHGKTRNGNIIRFKSDLQRTITSNKISKRRFQ